MQAGGGLADLEIGHGFSGEPVNLESRMNGAMGCKLEA